MSRGRLPILVLLAVLAPASGFAQGQQAVIPWRTDLMSARQEAMQSGRNMLVHFWATWCGPCQRLESTVFRQPPVVSTIHQNLIPVKLNADDNRQIAHLYGVKVLPTDVIVAPDGTVLASFPSPQDPGAYLAQIAPFGVAGRGRGPGDLAVAAGHQPRQQPYAPTVPFPAGGGAVQSAFVEVQSPGGPAAANVAGAGPQGGAGQVASANGGRYGVWNQGQVPDAGASPVAQTTQATTLAHNSNVGLSGSPRNVNGYGARYTDGYGNSTPGQALQPQSGQPGQYGMPGQTANLQGSPAAQPGTANPAQGPAQLAASPGSRYLAQSPISQQHTVLPRSEQAHGIGPGPAVAQATAPAAQASRPTLGLDGFCPVTLKREQRWIPGDKRYGIVHRGSLYLFVGPAQAQQFWDNPDQFSPVLSGIDPVLALDNGATVQGQREHGVEFNGMVYLFSSESTLQHFSRNPERYAAGVRQAMQTSSGTTLR